MRIDLKQTGPLDVNTYILKDEISKEAVLLDVGGSFEEIKQNLDAENYKIKFILNTHGHFDHVIGEFEIRKNYPEIPIYMHKDDISHFSNLKEEMGYFGLKPQNENFEITDFIDENSKLYFGRNKIQIFHTPGHSKGSLSYYIDGKLFSGDTLFFHSIGRTDLFGGDYDTLINSIKTKLFTLPDNTRVFPGHGPDTTIINEKINNSYLI